MRAHCFGERGMKRVLLSIGLGVLAAFCCSTAVADPQGDADAARASAISMKNAAIAIRDEATGKKQTADWLKNGHPNASPGSYQSKSIATAKSEANTQWIIDGVEQSEIDCANETGDYFTSEGDTGFASANSALSSGGTNLAGGDSDMGNSNFWYALGAYNTSRAAAESALTNYTAAKGYYDVANDDYTGFQWATWMYEEARTIFRLD